MISSSLLALSFGSPWLLLGIALAAIPAILHLLFRREHRAEPFAANRFLAEATRKHSRRLRFQHWVLLAVRMAILMLIAIALARPTLQDSVTQTPAGRAPIHHLFVLDATLSMRHRDRGQQRFDRGRAILQKTVETAHDGDTFRLLVIRAAGTPVVIAQAAGRRGDVLEELARLEPTWESGRELETLETTLALLNTPIPSGRLRVSLVTDLQRSAWQPPEQDRRKRIRDLLNSIRQQSELVVYDVSGPAASNTAVVELKSETAVAIVGEPVTLRATVSHFGPPEPTADPVTTQVATQVEWHIDGRMVARRELKLVPRGSTTAVWSHRFAVAGEHHAEVRLSSDGLPDDDHRHIALPVRDRLKVLLAGGRFGAGPDQLATFYVEAALDPGLGTADRSAETSDSPRVATTVIPESRLVGQDLDRHDCIVLCDVPRLDRLEASRLARFVSAGGGLVIGMGNSVHSESWNRLLGQAGSGLLPGRIGELVSADDPNQQAVVFDPGNYAHPLLEVFRGLDGNGLGTTVTLRYLGTTPLPGSQVALAFDSGDPAILVRRFGHGHVVMVTTSLDPRWTTWPVLSTSFPPMIHELVRYATSGRWSARNHLLGQPIIRPVGPQVTAGTLVAPDGSSLAMENPVAANTVPRIDPAQDPAQDPSQIPLPGTTARGRLVSDPLLVPGIYRLSLVPPAESIETYGVNLDTSESDLATAEGQTDRARLSGVDASIYTRWHDADAAAVFQEPGRPLSRLLLSILLGLLVVELAMAWKFPAGLVALGLLLAAGMLEVGGTAAVAVAVVAAAAVVVAGVAAVWGRRVLRNRYSRHRRHWERAG